MKPADRILYWKLSGDALTPWETRVNGERWQVRINDYTGGGPLYTLLVAGAHVEDLAEWPANWTRPELPADPDYVPPTPVAQDDPAQKAEYEAEGERYRPRDK